jgi:hypothetical protein
MADYYSLLSRAVGNLPKTSPAAARRAIYDRARQALISQLRSLKPPLPETDIAREENALDAAVARLEAEFESASAPAPLLKPPTTRPSAPPPAPVAAPAPPPQPPRAPPIVAARPAAPVISAAPPLEAQRGSVAPPGATLTKPAPIVAPALRSPPIAEAAPAPLVAAEASGSNGPDNAPRIQASMDAEGPPSPPVRAETDGMRPSAPTSVEPSRSNPWPWIALAVVVGLVGSVAIAAFLSRDRPQDLATKDTPETAGTGTPTPTGPKIGERVGGSPTPTASATPTPAGSATPDATPTPTPTPTPTASASPTPSATPAATPTTTATPAAGGATPAAISVAARAAMLVAVSGDPQKPAVSLGSVVWSSVAANPGQPGSSGFKAEIDIPDLKMHASVTMRKNVDQSLPASHTVDLRVTFDDGSSVKGVKDIGMPMMRRDDPPAADALLGVRVKINDSYFLVGLNRADSDLARNVDEIATRGWFDFPLLLSDDRIAKLTFEKGPDGERIVNDAVAGWK